MDKNQRPKVLLINCCTKSNPDIIKGILDADDDDKSDRSVSSNGLMTEHFLKIDNKYYTADLSLFSTTLEEQDEVADDITANSQALIISFEMKNDSIFGSIKAFGDKIRENDIDIKILFSTETERSCGLEERRKMILEWCIDNSFELVECYQTDDNEDFPEKFGFERIREALHTHIWPNMVEKPRGSADVKPRKTEQLQRQIPAQSSPTRVDANNKDPSIIGTQLEEQSFEEMFAKLQDMKLHADSLSDDKRKEYAENMAIAFWKAMGQDEEEISGL